MADACLMGDNSSTHVQAPGLARPLALVRQGEGLAVQCAGPFEVDGKACKGRAPITQKSIVSADDVRLNSSRWGHGLMVIRFFSSWGEGPGMRGMTLVKP